MHKLSKLAKLEFSAALAKKRENDPQWCFWMQIFEGSGRFVCGWSKVALRLPLTGAVEQPVGIHGLLN